MNKEHNIMLAKKYMVESIYRSANIEGIGVTFPETQTICDGMSVSGHSVDDINAVNDLKKAWQWIFQNVEEAVDVKSLCMINRLLGKYTVINASSFRDNYDEPIRVTLKDGNSYYPPLPPAKEEVDDIISNITNVGNLDCALELFCYVCKSQFFNDGNKRTATLIANMYMIKSGLGILSIPPETKLEFYEKLTSFYEDDENKEALKNFLEENCITGNGIAK